MRPRLWFFASLCAASAVMAAPSAAFLNAERAYAAGRAAEAVEGLRVVLKAEPDNDRAWFYLGNGLASLKKYAEAEAALRQAVTLQPRKADYVYNLASVRAMQGRADEAESFFRKAAELRPDFGAAWLSLARVHDGASNRRAAMEDLARFLANCPTAPERPRVEALMNAWKISAAADAAAGDKTTASKDAAKAEDKEKNNAGGTVNIQASNVTVTGSGVGGVPGATNRTADASGNAAGSTNAGAVDDPGAPGASYGGLSRASTPPRPPKKADGSPAGPDGQGAAATGGEPGATAAAKGATGSGEKAGAAQSGQGDAAGAAKNGNGAAGSGNGGGAGGGSEAPRPPAYSTDVKGGRDREVKSRPEGSVGSKSADPDIVE